MSYTNEFLLTGKFYHERSPESRGLQRNEHLLKELQSTLISKSDEGIKRIAVSQKGAAEVVRAEVEYQNRMLLNVLQSAIGAGADAITGAIQDMCDYLGFELTEVRWAIERQTEVCRKILEVLLNSLDNASRQYFEQGLKCYENGEYDLAKERFERALDANRTNYFAYQYLGFIATVKDLGEDAVRNFELARKFTDKEHLKALACLHLARAHYALGNRTMPVELSKEAADLVPSDAVFHYRLAQYCALAEMKPEAIKALRESCHLDMTYWTQASADKEFDMMREEVLRFQNDERNRLRTDVREVFKGLESAVLNGSKVQLGDKIRAFEEVLSEMRDKIQNDNVFVLLEARSQGEEVTTCLLSDCVECLKKQVRNREQEVGRVQQENREGTRQLEVDLKTAESTLRNFDADQFVKKQRQSFTRLIFWLSGCLVVLYLRGIVPPPFDLLLGLILLVYGIPVVIIVVSKLCALFRRRSLEFDIKSRAAQLAAAKDRVAEASAPTIRRLEGELTQLRHSQMEMQSGLDRWRATKPSRYSCTLGQGTSKGRLEKHRNGDDMESVVRALCGKGEKMAAIKRVRELTGLGLAEAKEFVERLS